MTQNVKRFIELQTKINNQIDQQGEADHSLVDELSTLGNQLTNDEIGVISNTINDTSDEMEYEDIEWLNW